MRRSSSTSLCSRISLLWELYIRHYSTASSSSSNIPSLTKLIPYRYRRQAIKQAQEALTDYLHNTRALSFTYAEHISKNSTHSLSDLIAKVPFSSPNFRKTLQKFLSYNPINEFGFFYESIGIDYVHLDGFLNPNLHFLSDDSAVFDAACSLAGFGFPWDQLGRLYVQEVSIFRKKPEFLSGRLDGLVSLGFSNQQVVGFCLAIPCLLKGEEVGFSSELDGLVDDLTRVFVDFGLGCSKVGSVDVWFELCRKLKVFYDLGVAKGEVGELIVRGNRSILTDYTEEVLVEKVDFFSRLGVKKAEVGLLILSNPEILSIELGDRVISVSSLLEHFGLRENEIQSVELHYKYVFGRNKMVNLPYILRAMNLHEWFFRRMKRGYHQLLANYDLSSPDDGVDENYIQNLESVKNVRTYNYSFSKLEFLHGIGFGGNGITMKLLSVVHGSASDLQLRFDFLLNEGIEFSQLCRMIIRAPKILNQEIDSMKKKLNFYRDEIRLPLDYMEIFPSYLLYNLEKRIIPRYKFHEWLTEKGWCTKKYTLASIVAISHKGFLLQLSCIHPTAPQLFLEQYGNTKLIDQFQKIKL